MYGKQKIVTLDIAVPNASAANTALSFSKRLNTDSNYKKCRGFIISETTSPGVAYDVSLNPEEKNTLIQPVNSNYVKLQSGIEPDKNLKTVEFDLPSEQTFVWITPKAQTTAAGVLQAIFLLTEK